MSDNTKRILVVDDESSITEFVGYALKKEGYNVDIFENGEDALNAARQNPYDLFVLDIMLPGMDGYELCRRLRSITSAPVLFLSARDTELDKVVGLEIGGDDYLAKPFSVAELLARVRALLRRASSVAEETSLRVEDLELDTRSRKVFRAGVRIDLQPLEYQLLEYLMRNRGRVVSRTTIMQHVWEYDFDTGTNIVESRMCRLREKVDKPFGRKLIRTVRGFGYVLD